MRQQTAVIHNVVRFMVKFSTVVRNYLELASRNAVARGD
jgi:hypothetical protein